MLLIQEIHLTWNKQERMGKYAKARSQFPLAYPLEGAEDSHNIVLHKLLFFQKGEIFLNSVQETRESLGKYFTQMGYSHNLAQHKIQKRICYLKQHQFQYYQSVQQLNLANLSVSSGSDCLEVSFFYDERLSGLPFRRGHNKDYHHPQSLLYGKDCLNEVAFLLKPKQYGRIIWNERKADYDTGAWYYQMNLYNLILTDCMPTKNMFLINKPDFEYRQMAVLY